MKKLKLQLESLEVQSFEATPEIDLLEGTVQAAEASFTKCDVTCGRPSCCHTEEI